MRNHLTGNPPALNRRIPRYALPLLLFIILYIGIEYGERFLTRGIIFDGIFCEGIYLGGKRVEDVLRIIDDYEERVVRRSILLRYKDKLWHFDPSEAGIGINKEAIIKDAYAEGRRGDILERFRQRRGLKRETHNIAMCLTGDEGALRELLRMIADEVDLPSLDAGFIIDEDKRISITEGRYGRALPREETLGKIIDALTGDEKVVDIDVNVLYPEWTRDQLFAMGIDGPISSFTTKFDVTKVERAHNILLGAKSICGIILPPGAVLSFNESVGPRSEKAGYMAAPVIVGDELIPDFGGGICQVSTTLYNAALLAEMEIVERSNHSIPVAYVPLGRDATVAYNYIDLKIRNNREEHLLIWAYVNEGSLTVEIYGKSQREALKQIVISSEIVKVYPPPKIREEDPEMPAGQITIGKEGSNGYDVRVWMIILEEGKESRRLLSRDYYRPIPSVERIGIKQEALIREFHYQGYR